MEYWLITAGPDKEPGINGGMVRKGKGEPVALTISVVSLDEATKKITEAGGKIEKPKSAIPGVGWFARFTDTEGNAFGLMESDMNAK